jgi:hypothetical protein
VADAMQARGWGRLRRRAYGRRAWCTYSNKCWEGNDLWEDKQELKEVALAWPWFDTSGGGLVGAISRGSAATRHVIVTNSVPYKVSKKLSTIQPSSCLVWSIYMLLPPFKKIQYNSCILLS